MNRNFYINGSAAPARIIDEPVRKPRRTAPLTKEQIRKRQVDRYAEANRERAVRFGRLYTLFIAVAVAVTMAASVGFIKEYNRNTANNNKIKTLSEQLSKAKEANDLKKLTIDTSIDFDYIYKTATEELGMVHAGKNQIVEYKSGESEYVIQYKDITKGE